MESAQDKEIISIIEALRSGQNEEGNTWPASLSEYKREKEHLSEKDGIVLFKSRILVPCSLRTKVLEVLHAAHQGCSSMLARASQGVWWPKLGESIEKIRASCQECTRTAQKQATLPPPSPDFPIQQICLDIK